MRRTIAAALLFSMAGSSAGWAAKDKKLPSGEATNDVVSIEATYFDAAQLKDTFGTDFDNIFSVVEVTLTPKGGKPLEVHLDDFLMRSESSGAHSGALAASQIAGQDTLVVHQADTRPKRGVGFGGGLGPMVMGGGAGNGAPPPESKVEVKNSEKRDPMLDVLKRKILAEKPTSEPVTGLLFFPLDKEKPKNLVLIYTTPNANPPAADPSAPGAAGPGASGPDPSSDKTKLRIRFK
jgi:hypothetical protein